jgi:hypothetical protein
MFDIFLVWTLIFLNISCGMGWVESRQTSKPPLSFELLAPLQSMVVCGCTSHLGIRAGTPKYTGALARSKVFPWHGC